MVQTEVPSSVRAFWETGSSNPGAHTSSLGMNSARAPGESCLIRCLTYQTMCTSLLHDSSAHFSGMAVACLLLRRNADGSLDAQG